MKMNKERKLTENVEENLELLLKRKIEKRQKIKR